MSQDSVSSATSASEPVRLDLDPEAAAPSEVEPQPSYVKLAMRNMVRKSGTSLRHFGLTVAGLLGVLVGLAYLFR